MGRDDSAPAAWAMLSLGALEVQESSLVGRAGSSGGRRKSSGPHLQQVRCETSSVTQSCAMFHCCSCWPPANELERANSRDMWETAGLAWLRAHRAQTLICHCHFHTDQVTRSQQPVPVGGGFLPHHQQADLHWAGDREFLCVQADGAKDCTCLCAVCYNLCSSYCNFLPDFFCCAFLISMTVPYSQWHWQVLITGIKRIKVSGHSNGLQWF